MEKEKKKEKEKVGARENLKGGGGALVVTETGSIGLGLCGHLIIS